MAKQFAADQMAVGVVDILEAIEVKEGEADRCALDSDALEFTIEYMVEVAGVEEASAVVGDGELLDAGDVVSVFDRDGGVVGEDVEKSNGVVVHLVGAGIDDLDNAVGSLAAAER